LGNAKQILIQNSEQTFLTIKDKLKSKIGEASFESWLHGLGFDDFNSGLLTLSLPNQFSSDYVERNYKDQIHEIFNEYFDDIKTIKIQVKQKKHSSTPSVNNNSIVKKIEEIKNNTPAWFSQDKINPLYTFENFCNGESNRLSYAVAKKITSSDEKLYNPFFLHSEVGLGKTHLLHAIANEIKDKKPQASILIQPIQKFSESYVRSIKANQAHLFKAQFSKFDILLIDDFQFIDGKKSFQKEFLHVLNEFISSGKQIVITSNRKINNLILSPELKSRLISGLTADLKRPQKELRNKIIISKSTLLGEGLNPKITDFLTETLNCNIREIEGAVKQIFAHSKLLNCSLDISSVKKIIADLIHAPQNIINFETILQKTSIFYNVSIPEINGKRRTKRIVNARRIVMFLTAKLTDYSYSDIGRKLGGKDHSTISHALKAVSKQEKTTPQLFNDIEAIETILKTI